MTMLERLRQLNQEATPSPWFWTHHTGTPYVGDGLDKAANLVAGAYGASGGVLGCDHRTPNQTNAALIAEVRNALPALLAVAEAAKVVADECSPTQSPANGSMDKLRSALAGLGVAPTGEET